MHEVGAVQFTEEQRPVPELCDHGLGGTGLMGTTQASISGSFFQPSTIRCACTACPPRMRSEATTMATRRGRDDWIWLGPDTGQQSCKSGDLNRNQPTAAI